ncbi:hypothetical protein ABVT39_005058 [Epinephelus coioides]
MTIFLQTFAFSIIANKESGSLPREFVNYQIFTVLAVQEQTAEQKPGQKVDSITLDLPYETKSSSHPLCKTSLLPTSFLYLLSFAFPSLYFHPCFWTALLSHIFLPVFVIAFPLLLRPPYGGEQQMAACLYVTPQPNLNREECKSPGLQISEATQLSALTPRSPDSNTQTALAARLKADRMAG